MIGDKATQINMRVSGQLAHTFLQDLPKNTHIILLYVHFILPSKVCVFPLGLCVVFLALARTFSK